MALSDHQALIEDFAVGLVDELGLAARDRALAAAVQRYGRDRPRRLVADVTSVDGRTLALPAAADPDQPFQLEHPIDDDPPAYLDADDWIVYRGPTTTEIRLVGSLAAGAVVRMTYGASHVVDATTDTIPVRDREAVACYAAATLADMMALRTAGDGSPTIGADSVDHGSKSSNYAARANRLRQRYFELLGIDPKRLAPASATGTVPSKASWGSSFFQRRSRGRIGGVS
jgi:hypothetical protein